MGTSNDCPLNQRGGPKGKGTGKCGFNGKGKGGFKGKGKGKGMYGMGYDPMPGQWQDWSQWQQPELPQPWSSGQLSYSGEDPWGYYAGQGGQQPGGQALALTDPGHALVLSDPDPWCCRNLSGHRRKS